MRYIRRMDDHIPNDFFAGEDRKPTKLVSDGGVVGSRANNLKRSPAQFPPSEEADVYHRFTDQMRRTHARRQRVIRDVTDGSIDLRAFDKPKFFGR